MAKKILILPKLNQTANLIKFSVVTGVMGNALNSQALKTASTTSASYVVPMINLSMANMMLKNLQKNKVK